MIVKSPVSIGEAGEKKPLLESKFDSSASPPKTVFKRQFLMGMCGLDSDVEYSILRFIENRCKIDQTNICQRFFVQNGRLIAAGVFRFP